MQIRVKKDGAIFKFLTETTLKETDKYSAQISKFSYKSCINRDHAPHCYMLTPLGFLNGLIGLELVYDDLTSLDASAEDSSTSSSS